MSVRATCVFFAIAGVCAHAQWLNHPHPGIPRTGDGKPNLTAPAPKAADGKPDLSGIWQAESTPVEELSKFLPGGGNGLGEDIPSKYFINILWDFKPEETPLLPSAAAAFLRHAQAMGGDNPDTRCQPPGPNAIDYPAPFKVVQTPGLTVLLYEAGNSFRQIFTDGRKHTPDPQPTWAGYSVGRWEDDTLVIDTTGFNDRSWLDALGHIHSDELRIQERFRRRDFGHMDVQIRITDPKTLTKPVTVSFSQRLLPDTDLLEYVCTENEKDVQHLPAH